MGELAKHWSAKGLILTSTYRLLAAGGAEGRCQPCMCTQDSPAAPVPFPRAVYHLGQAVPELLHPLLTWRCDLGQAVPELLHPLLTWSFALPASKLLSAPEQYLHKAPPPAHSDSWSESRVLLFWTEITIILIIYFHKGVWLSLSDLTARQQFYPS